MKDSYPDHHQMRRRSSLYPRLALTIIIPVEFKPYKDESLAFP
jgi:hypothetical protein